MIYLFLQMVLHRSNFEIPARFSFRPFKAHWEICTAELMQWWERPTLNYALAVPIKPLLPAAVESEMVVVRIEVPDESSAAGYLGLMGLYGHRSHTLQMDRLNIPSDVLKPHENRKTSPDISERSFPVLVCKEPEFKALFPSVKPGNVVKNAWAMRDEFLNLDGADSADDFDWLWNSRQFLNRWGLWSHGLGFLAGMSAELPGFSVVFPHSLREKRKEFRKALESKNSGKWLSTAPPLSFSTIQERPHFLVERFFCEDAIRATITIDHLAKRKFGFCKRCGRQFEQETEHKKSYCSRQCIQAAGVKRWRDKRKKKPSVKGIKRDAKG